MIPFNKPFIVGKELYYISKAVIEMAHISGGGSYTRRCQEWLQKNLNCTKALLTHSCTAALEMACILCDLRAGDEVIMPSYTFVSTANAVVLRGAVPVFVDICEDTLNIDDRLIQSAVTEKTKAIIPVHYAGVPCRMDNIMQIAKTNSLFVIEDAAQGLLSSYDDAFLGTIGHFGAVSFHETKNVISGEGGALLINDNAYVERAEIVWEKGTDRKKFFEGKVNKYSWVDIGSSFLPSDMIAAFLFAQFEAAEKIMKKRMQLFFTYYEKLKSLQSRTTVRLPVCHGGNQINAHLFYLIVNSLDERNLLIQHLNEREVNAISHYVPLHSSLAGMRYGRVAGSMVQTESISERIVRLPLYYEMSEKDVVYVAEAILDFYGNA